MPLVSIFMKWCPSAAFSHSDQTLHTGQNKHQDASIFNLKTWLTNNLQGPDSEKLKVCLRLCFSFSVISDVFLGNPYSSLATMTGERHADIVSGISTVQRNDIISDPRVPLAQNLRGMSSFVLFQLMQIAGRLIFVVSLASVSTAFANATVSAQMPPGGDQGS